MVVTLAPGATARQEQPPPPAHPRSESVAGARLRHRELYEAEYSWQEHRLHRLRQSIRRQLEDPPDGGGTR